MVERRRPRGGSAGRGASSGGARRPSTRRSAPAPRPSGLSPITVLLLAVPTAGILGLGAWMLFRSPQKTEPVVHNENAKMQDLVQRAGDLEREVDDVIRAFRKEAPGARERAEKFRDRINAWMDEWDEVTKPLEVAPNQLAPEYQGYAQYRSRMNTVYNDFLKSTGF